ncbi:nucleotide pyrophosphohydrolase [Carnobacteriaceae bacterium zg-ZUI78]|uniref:MazG nucleotide pyrophosphohydrolase domain-containing protein n=1 Tax=Granulicatella sp. zg-84 TaxID=2678503 RepID=UPI0013BF99AC|nr:MazG nucleotide pyrophosphohydrolase domain-containing protein [Granulicatella sp. zg-84]MBS4750882.1 nucleotide pyrophosphohydrolase [Carnobacteriaceae bacterium zg-ZUI78]NEW65551.1 nucleotide pyrophosphohydrolase [Granulicatella sp. zg-84]QMI85567.1 nucleotide pyrophosphohydrolase [Carnobacteriaceae bacterium zg-84]
MLKIDIIGLGGGDLEQMTVGVYKVIQKAIDDKQIVYLRTKEHPVINTLEQQGLLYESFDDIYEHTDTFEETYEKIVMTLKQLAKENEHILYAVPGHPMVAEKVVQTLLQDKEIEVTILGGKSFIDDLLQAVQVDMIDGFQLVDALGFKVDDLVLTQSIMIMQVFNEYVASDVKLALMERYPDDYQVALVHGAGTSTEKVEWLPLYEIDRLKGVYNLTTLFVPALERDAATKSFQTLQAYMDDIAKHDIWLKEQTHETLLPYLQEEVNEVIMAVEQDDIDNLIEELGDVLWQVLFQTSVAEYDGFFNLEDVLDTLNRKIRRRHPHVFDGVKVESVEELDALWQKIKQKEKDENK